MMLGEFKSFRDEIRDMIRPIAITVANHTPNWPVSAATSGTIW